MMVVLKQFCNLRIGHFSPLESEVYNRIMIALKVAYKDLLVNL